MEGSGNWVNEGYRVIKYIGVVLATCDSEERPREKRFRSPTWETPASSRKQSTRTCPLNRWDSWLQRTPLEWQCGHALHAPGCPEMFCSVVLLSIPQLQPLIRLLQPLADCSEQTDAFRSC